MLVVINDMSTFHRVIFNATNKSSEREKAKERDRVKEEWEKMVV